MQQQESNHDCWWRRIWTQHGETKEKKTKKKKMMMMKNKKTLKKKEAPTGTNVAFLCTTLPRNSIFVSLCSPHTHTHTPISRALGSLISVHQKRHMLTQAASHRSLSLVSLFYRFRERDSVCLCVCVCVCVCLSFCVCVCVCVCVGFEVE